MFKMIVPVVAVALTAPAIAFAGPEYSAQDIEKHFTTPANVNLECPVGEICLPKKPRGVCVGTASKCGREEVATATAAPSAFDLLITFQLGSDRLSPQAQENLAEFARALNGDALKSAVFNVDGHTDASGSNDFNMSLSQRRAASVVSYLEELGVDRSRLKAQGFGETSPRADDPFAAINRRVEATVRVR
ncbi:MAG: OmpA family protein [Pseudomonadota bacterium]